MAKRDDWKTKDFPSEFSTVRLNKILSEEEFRQAEKGLIPRAIEDKWFIFFENGWFYMHRSWSGFCIYKIRVNADGANYLLDELFINRNKEQYNTADDEYDKLLAAYLFYRLLLSRNVLFQHHLVLLTVKRLFSGKALLVMGVQAAKCKIGPW